MTNESVGSGPHTSRQYVTGLLQTNRHAEAQHLLEALCRENPRSAWPWFLLGTLHGQQRAFDECIRCLGRAIESDPAHGDAHFNLAQAYMHVGRTSEAVAEYRTAAQLNPKDATRWNNLGHALNRIGDSVEAMRCLEQALALRPDDADARVNLASALINAGRNGAAIAHLRAAVASRPDHAVAQANLARSLWMAGELTEALTQCDTGLRLHPEKANLHGERGMILQLQGLAEQADADFARAAELAADSDAVAAGRMFNMNYFCDEPARLAAAHRRWAERIELALGPPAPHLNDRGPERRLRVGFISADLYQHPVGLFLEPLIERLDREAFETYAYAGRAVTDAVSGRLKQSFTHWRDIAGLDAGSAATLIRRDAIDILVDLGGLTAAALASVCALKPAPVQVSWLGYPNTCGLRAIDYRLTDAFADPAGEADELHAERLIRLAGGFLCYRPPRESPPVSSPPSDRLGYVTFGSFNNLAKLGPRVISAWAAILSRVPGSRLLLKCHGFQDQAVARRVRRAFSDAGISADRIALRHWTPSATDHLDMYAHIDIALDTFPYNGATTTCEALWMGVPVVCLAGNRHAGRVGVSLLSAIGTPALIGRSQPEYESIAVALAQNGERRAALRRELRARIERSPLRDEAGFARQVEAALRAMWRDWAAPVGGAASR